MRRTILHADESFQNPETGNFLVVAITENEPGYSTMAFMPEYLDLESAKAQAARFNKSAGFSEADLLAVRLSSMINKGSMK